MTTHVDVDAPIVTEQERAALATRRLCAALDLGTLKPKDLKHLSVALTEAATDEVALNRAFAERILYTYRALIDASTPKRAPRGALKEPARKPAKPKLVPIGHVDPALLGPDMPLDPYVLQQLYGNDQLRLALEGRALKALQQAADIVQQRHPSSAPAKRSQKAALIDYIVRYVAG